MITITNNNIYYSEFPISTLSNMDSAKIVDIEDIIQFLTDSVELSESLKLKRLFDIISYNVDKFNEIFYSALGGYSIDPFLQEIENIQTEKTEFDYLEIHWFCDKYEDELSISPSLHGISKDKEYYAIDFVSLNNIKDYIVKINQNIEYFDYKFDKSKKDDDDCEPNLNNLKNSLGNKTFTLFDLYHAILAEISFHGGPQEKKDRFDELKESIDEAEESYENHKEDLLSFDELLEKYDTNDKFLVKYNDLRDRVDEDRITNENNLPQLKSCLEEKLKIYHNIQNTNENLSQYYKKLTDVEYNMQLLYGEEEDITFHRFWDTPKCTCPKIDNVEIYPSKPIFDENCPIHKK